MPITRAVFAALALALALAACGDNPKQRVPAEPEQPREGVYVARYVPLLGPDGRPAHARLALFHGSYGVVNDCLVFDMGGPEPALARFPTGTRVDIHADHVVIGETSIASECANSATAGTPMAGWSNRRRRIAAIP
ncbi:hypothetical protein [Croceicoccus marinus]|uniref:Lipoprotein n=1 Tax=Croceicoccus marinus TaxID=450378 RepID=A0A1Z1FEE3_9SPHN|nr:hypothetical protein [Croceicoccus marinus]ARU17110.1 hypothetical protein A9D14_14240 [Croceicoccus marinus]